MSEQKDTMTPTQLKWIHWLRHGAILARREGNLEMAHREELRADAITERNWLPELRGYSGPSNPDLNTAPAHSPHIHAGFKDPLDDDD
jgi:hypothetical protein